MSRSLTDPLFVGKTRVDKKEAVFDKGGKRIPPNTYSKIANQFAIASLKNSENGLELKISGIKESVTVDYIPSKFNILNIKLPENEFESTNPEEPVLMHKLFDNLHKDLSILKHLPANFIAFNARMNFFVDKLEAPNLEDKYNYYAVRVLIEHAARYQNCISDVLQELYEKNSENDINSKCFLDINYCLEYGHINKSKDFVNFLNHETFDYNTLNYLRTCPNSF